MEKGAAGWKAATIVGEKLRDPRPAGGAAAHCTQKRHNFPADPPIAAVVGRRLGQGEGGDSRGRARPPGKRSGPAEGRAVADRQASTGLPERKNGECRVSFTRGGVEFYSLEQQLNTNAGVGFAPTPWQPPAGGLNLLLAAAAFQAAATGLTGNRRGCAVKEHPPPASSCRRRTLAVKPPLGSPVPTPH